MKKETKELLIKYLGCFGIAALISVAVFWSNGFFTDSVSNNIQVLADGFFISGILFLIVAGLLFVSDEGALLGIGFIFRNIILTFIPMGRMKHELYADYRERKLKDKKKMFDYAILFTGLVFFLASVILSVVWSYCFYDAPDSTVSMLLKMA